MIFVMNKKIEEIQDKFIQQIMANMKSYGFPSTIGHVLAVIYYENKPLSLDELSERTGMSKTRMSQVVREMVHLNIAEKVFVKGTRKDYYRVEEDYYRTFISLFTSNWKAVAMRNTRADRSIYKDLQALQSSDDLSEEERQLVDMYIEDTKQSMAYFDWVNRLVDFFESEEVFKYVPKKEIK